MLNNGLMSGMTAYKFEPNTNITRAMFVSLLYRLAGRPNVSLSASSSNSFSDVRDQNSYYYYAVAWASSRQFDRLLRKSVDRLLFINLRFTFAV